MAAELSKDLKLLDDDAVGRIRNTLSGLGLPINAEGIKPEEVRKAMGFDKKAVAGKPRFVVLRGIGGANVTADVAAPLILDAIRRCCD